MWTIRITYKDGRKEDFYCFNEPIKFYKDSISIFHNSGVSHILNSDIEEMENI